MQNRETSNFINRYSSPGGGGEIPLKMLITLKILSTLKSAKICQISISFVHIATLPHWINNKLPLMNDYLGSILCSSLLSLAKVKQKYYPF